MSNDPPATYGSFSQTFRNCIDIKLKPKARQHKVKTYGIPVPNVLERSKATIKEKIWIKFTFNKLYVLVPNVIGNYATYRIVIIINKW